LTGVVRRSFKPAAEMPRGEATEPADTSGETGAADVPSEAESSLAKARAALLATDEELARLATERDAALLRDDDAEAVRLDGEVEQLQRLRRAHVDKVALREREAERAAAEQRAAERAGAISAVEGLLGERDRVGGELAAAIDRADKCFVRMLELAREVKAAWSFASHDHAPALLADSAVLRELTHEIYRVAARPVAPGAMIAPAAPSFPGGKFERIEHALLPSKIRPLTEKLAEASEFASRCMRDGFSSNQLSPALSGAASPGDTGQSNIEPLPQVSPFKAEPNPELAKVLARMNALASRQMSEDDERLYQELGRKCQELSAE
jgi:hypothetical protein